MRKEEPLTFRSRKDTVIAKRGPGVLLVKTPPSLITAHGFTKIELFLQSSRNNSLQIPPMLRKEDVTAVSAWRVSPLTKGSESSVDTLSTKGALISG